MITPEQAAEIDMFVAVAIGGLKLGAELYPPFAVAVPLFVYIINREAAKLKSGLADGTVVPDGHGGFVPSSNSHFDPVTGRFL